MAPTPCGTTARTHRHLVMQLPLQAQWDSSDWVLPDIHPVHTGYTGWLLQAASKQEHGLLLPHAAAQ